MKRLISAITVLVLCFYAFSAQAYYWEFKEHGTSPAQIKREIDSFIRNGYMPVGLTFLQGRLNMLYVNDGSLSTNAWHLGEYGSQGQLKNGLNQMTNKGYTPMGLSYNRGFFYVIYIATTTPVKRWAVITSGLNLQSLQREIRPYTSNGYVPFGLGSTATQFLTLLVKTTGIDVSRWSIMEYALNRNVIKNMLNRNAAMGNIPFGFLHHGGRVYLVFLTP